MPKIEGIHDLELFDNYMDMHVSPFYQIAVFDFECSKLYIIIEKK